MKKSDFENFLKNIISKARYDYDSNEYTDFDLVDEIIEGIIKYGYCVPPYLSEDENLIKVSSYLQGPFCWEPEED
jgi:hypothetical protein